MTKIFYYILYCTCLIIIPSQALCLPVAHITGKAVDEDGNPIIGGNVYIVFTNLNLSAGQTSTNLITDKNGKFEASGECSEYVGFRVDKQGYYQSSAGYKFTKRSKLSNKWKPWNPTIKVVLKKKRNPVPMYIKDTGWIAIPKLDTQIGYDLEKGDWVAPYGIGVENDLIIEFNLSKQSYLDYDANLTITFNNKTDGIQEYYHINDQSSYRWPFESPVNGYKNIPINIFERDKPDPGNYKTNKKEKVDYIFRVRSRVDDQGNVVDAKYGKISGEFGISRKGKTRFMYYFNPDGTRNLEHDLNKNLFPHKKR